MNEWHEAFSLAWDLMPWQGSLETVLLGTRKDYERYEQAESLNGVLELCPQEGRLRQEDIPGRKDPWYETSKSRQPTAFSGCLENVSVQCAGGGCWHWAMLSALRRVMFGNAGPPGVSEMMGSWRSTGHGGAVTNHQNRGSHDWLDARPWRHTGAFTHRNLVGRVVHQGKMKSLLTKGSCIYKYNTGEATSKIIVCVYTWKYI